MGITLKLMIRYKKEGGKNLQAYFAGLLALQTIYRTHSDYKTTAVRRFIKSTGLLRAFSAKISKENKVKETDNPKAV